MSLPSMMASTLDVFFDINDFYWYMFPLNLSWKLIHFSAIVIHIALNFLLQLDIYLTVKNPFFPRARRNNYYIGFLVLIEILTLMILL